MVVRTGRSASWCVTTPSRFFARSDMVLDLIGAWGENEDGFLPQDGERQAVVRQEHVRPDDREIDLLLLQRLCALSHVVERNQGEANILFMLDQRFGKCTYETGLDAIARADRHRRRGKIVVAERRERRAERQDERAETEAPFPLAQVSEK